MWARIRATMIACWVSKRPCRRFPQRRQLEAQLPISEVRALLSGRAAVRGQNHARLVALHYRDALAAIAGAGFEGWLPYCFKARGSQAKRGSATPTCSRRRPAMR